MISNKQQEVSNRVPNFWDVLYARAYLYGDLSMCFMILD